jgi:hypothetical protein
MCCVDRLNAQPKADFGLGFLQLAAQLASGLQYLSNLSSNLIDLLSI